MDDELKRLFGDVLAAAQAQSASATGSSEYDAIYDQAASVRLLTGELVYVTYQGKEYGPTRMSWGPLDGDKEKSTVKIQVQDGLWYHLWFWDKDIQKK